MALTFSPPPKHSRWMIPEEVLDLCFYRLPSVGFLRDFGENVFQQQFPTFIARFRQGPQNGFDKQGFYPVLIRPTQRLTQPNRGPPWHRTAPPCQRPCNSDSREGGLSSLSYGLWPPEVRPGYRPKLRPTYSRMQCPPCRKRGSFRLGTMQTA